MFAYTVYLRLDIFKLMVSNVINNILISLTKILI